MEADVADMCLSKAYPRHIPERDRRRRKDVHIPDHIMAIHESRRTTVVFRAVSIGNPLQTFNSSTWIYFPLDRLMK